MSTNSNKINRTVNRDAQRFDLGYWLRALDPNSVELDQRTVADRLGFAASYAKLINFYDLDNRHNGDWSGFFLKDQRVLLASVGNIEYSGLHAQFLQLTTKIENLIEFTEPNKIAQSVGEIGHMMSAVFTLTNNMFADIDSWILHLQKQRQVYSLKDFVIDSCQRELLVLLKLHLQTQSCLARRVKDIAPVHENLFVGFKQLQKVTKASSAAAIPIQDKLKQAQAEFAEFVAHEALVEKLDNAKTSDREKIKSIAILWKFLKFVYRQTFDFYVQVIDQAKSEYTTQTEQGNCYPDTALLISFAELMNLQQQQLNELTEKHLDLYYQGILKQSIQGASADKVYVCVSLTSKAQELCLKKGTEFLSKGTGGGSSSTFVNLDDQIINQIKLNQVRTLSNLVYPKDNLQHRPSAVIINAPQKVRKNLLGETLAWPIFGQAPLNPEMEIKQTQAKQAIVFASPMLFLESGERTINLRMTFADDASHQQFGDHTLVSLSSAETWLPFSNQEAKYSQVDKKVINLELSLGLTIPKIAPLANPPVGIESKWPMLKIEFGNGVDLSDSMQLQKISIDTDIKKYRPPKFYANESLQSSTNILPFGSIANDSDALYIASQELFAKPLTNLDLTLSWKDLPEKFSTYYQAYNDYIAKQKLYDWTFDNENFKVQFSTVQSDIWGPPNLPINMVKEEEAGKQYKSPRVDMFEQNSDGVLLPGIKFSLIDGSDVKPAKVNFSGESKEKQSGDHDGLALGEGETQDEAASDKLFPPTTSAQPQLLLTPLKIANRDHGGFIRMQLCSPIVGFGQSLYSAVMNDVVMTNAQKLISEASLLGKVWKVLFPKSAKLQVLPTKPFVPKMEKLELHYSARVNHHFSYQPSPENYPLEIFHYGSFSNYQIYDATSPNSQLDTNLLIPGRVFVPLVPSNHESSIDHNGFEKTSTTPKYKSLPTYQGVNQGALYLAFESVAAPCTLSLLIDIKPSVNNKNSASPVFSYLSAEGWLPLTVLTDTTRNLSQTGILEVQIENNIDNSSVLMPADYCWLAISVDQDAACFGDVVIMDTQAITLERRDLSELAIGETPVVAANSKIGTSKPDAEIAQITQALASFGGQAEEDQASFHQRVSGRIRNKGRSCNLQDYEKIAVQLDSNICYAQCALINNFESRLRLSLVKNYPDPAVASAYQPVLNGAELVDIENRILNGTSPFVQLDVVNMQQVPVQVTTSIDLHEPLTALETLSGINQKLRLYLSPWISSVLVQRPIDQGLVREQVIDFLLSLDEVKSVQHLSFTCANRHGLALVSQPDSALLTSVKEHFLSTENGVVFGKYQINQTDQQIIEGELQ